MHTSLKSHDYNYTHTKHHKRNDVEIAVALDKENSDMMAILDKEEKYHLKLWKKRKAIVQ
jgi:hypothetical protein